MQKIHLIIYITALFAHGGVLMCARVHAGQLPPAEALRQLTPFGGIVRITL
mgnify:CR=1 FL=1